ncbi:hypothetical protein RLIN73S_02609 [Rhodanobacter lindaniclasticus]
MAIGNGGEQAAEQGVAVLRDGPHAVELRPDVMVAMHDGVQLAVDLYLPRAGDSAAPSRWPCLLERTPYDKAGTAQSDLIAGQPQPLSKPRIARWFASHGYVVAMQDCRGRYRSQGTFTKYTNEAADGADTVGLAGGAAVERRPRADPGAVLRRPCADRAGQSRAAGLECAVHRFRRLLQRLPGWHPPGRCVRS